MLSAKENALRLYNHEKTEYMPIMGEGIINNVPVAGFRERGCAGPGTSGKDWFGVDWNWKSGEPAPMPVPPYVMDDICDWKDVVKFPDLDAFDWEASAAKDRIPVFDRENNVLYQMIHNGMLERLQNLMLFEEALCSMITDPDEVKAFFFAMADYKCALIDKLEQYYKPDVICYHDDWGTQRGLMISQDLWRDLIKEPTKQIVDHTRKKGIRFELHSDGMVRDLIPEVVDDLHVDSLNIMAINDIPALKKITGDKVVYNVFVDTQKLDVLDAAGTLDEESLRKAVREDILAQAEGGCFIPCMILVRPEWSPIITDELHHCQELLRA